MVVMIFLLFDGMGWNVIVCVDCGVIVDWMLWVEMFGVGVGQVCGIGVVLVVGVVDVLCEQIVVGVDCDGDVLVLCGVILIVWIIIFVVC